MAFDVEVPVPAPARRHRRVLAVVVGAWLMAGVGQLSMDRWFDWTYDSPRARFARVAVSAGLCALLSAALLGRGLVSGQAEAALLGSFLVSISLLPLVHGVLMSGVWYGPNEAVTVSMLLAVPVGSLALFPLVAPDSRLANRLARRWRPFVVVHLSLIISLAVVLLARPDLIPAPAPLSVATIGVIVWSFGWCAVASRRHCVLALVSGRPGSLGVAVGFAFIGTAPLVFAVGKPFGAGFWLSHIFDSTGVLLAAGLALVVYRRSGTLGQVLGPLEMATPLRALEVGLDPLVHRFVADLDCKDQVTRDHVIRTARMAVWLAGDLGLAPPDIRTVGVAAILHDVGKLDIPDAILNKTDRLTEAEFDVMKTHAATGGDMVAGAPALGAAAPLVRGHHERWDGAGYPDGLAGEEIPLGARLVAVCDAYDAMSNTRQYRQALTPEKVQAILTENSGSQWDSRLVAALHDRVTRIVRGSGVFDAAALADVGRDPGIGVADGEATTSICPDALPPISVGRGQS